MTFGAIFDVIVGLVFAYFLLALVASGLQEVIAALFTWRGTYLSKGIDIIISNAENATWKWGSWGDVFKAYLTPGAPPTAAQRMRQESGLVDPAQAALQRVLGVQTHPLVRGSPTDLPSYVPARNFALAMLDTLRDGSNAPLFTQAERTVATLPEGDLKRTLSLFLQSAAGDLDAFRDQIEHWFDDAMDRLSGIYKRLSQYVVLFLGLMIAVTLNVDSIRLSRTLWQESGVRSAIVADAGAWAKAGSNASSLSDGTCKPQQASPGGQTPSNPVSSVSGPVQTALACFEQDHLPFGWSGMNKFGAWTVPGWIVTMLAVGLGAPFWFGLLQQLTNIRSSGPAPARSGANGGGGQP